MSAAALVDPKAAAMMVAAAQKAAVAQVPSAGTLEGGDSGAFIAIAALSLAGIAAFGFVAIQKRQSQDQTKSNFSLEPQGITKKSLERDRRYI